MGVQQGPAAFGRTQGRPKAALPAHGALLADEHGYWAENEEDLAQWADQARLTLRRLEWPQGE
ncbi:hypothetical protein ACFQVC_28045 [Streptomyces monticola]|uniref:Uncharacterized protein n=1 Tax=Streptomyces monticola TaxID=2666263 RepID=A0ABW2JQ52_9ACTN